MSDQVEYVFRDSHGDEIYVGADVSCPSTEVSFSSGSEEISMFFTLEQAEKLIYALNECIELRRKVEVRND